LGYLFRIGHKALLKSGTLRDDVPPDKRRREEYMRRIVSALAALAALALGGGAGLTGF